MTLLTADWLLAVVVVLSFLWLGLAICARAHSRRPIERVIYSLGGGALVYALVGWELAATHSRRAVLITLLLLHVIALIEIVRGRSWRTFIELRRVERFCLGIWVAFVLAVIAVTHLKVPLPAVLPDGQYIFKTDCVHVQLQRLTTLPADNYIPFVVSEFFLRRISFSDNRPILPGQELSNRTVLMSLIALPFRSAIERKLSGPARLPTFRYLGSQWPDVETLDVGNRYRHQLVIGIVLNSLMLPGVLLLLPDNAAAKIGVTAFLLLATNSYIISQTVFIWPKALAGFFILLAWHTARRQQSPALAALWTALAYHSHPYAAAFAVGMLAWYCYCGWRKTLPLASAAIYALVFAVAIAPWFIWTRVLLGIPSDLVAQNFAVQQSLAGEVWPRISNVFNLFAPRMLMSFSFDADQFTELALFCLPGAVGIFVIVPALIEGVDRLRRDLFNRTAVLLPVVLLVLIFSKPALPIFHGLQVVVAMLIALAVVRLARTQKRSVFAVIVAAQLACNVALLWLRGAALGVHL